jgi:transposase-like protein
MAHQKKSEKRFSAEEKIRILEEGEYGSMSINEVCRRHQISTVTYYTWRKQAREAMRKGFSGALNKKSKREQEMEEQITRLQNTILEITQENVDLKKRNSR